jgi:hypothetical protein
LLLVYFVLIDSVVHQLELVTLQSFVEVPVDEGFVEDSIPVQVTGDDHVKDLAVLHIDFHVLGETLSLDAHRKVTLVGDVHWNSSFSLVNANAPALVINLGSLVVVYSQMGVFQVKLVVLESIEFIISVLDIELPVAVEASSTLELNIFKDHRSSCRDYRPRDHFDILKDRRGIPRVGKAIVNDDSPLLVHYKN